MPSTLVGVYWRARAAQQSGCSAKALAHFELLAKAGAGLDNWFQKASRKPKEPVPANVTSLDGLGALWRANRTEIGGSVITELGWSLSLWNGDRCGASATTNLHCGCTSERVSNSAVVKVTREDGTGLEDAEAVELLKALIELWDADTGVVEQSAWNEETQQREQSQVASYERRSWPLLLAKNAVQHARGVITLS